MRRVFKNSKDKNKVIWVADALNDLLGGPKDQRYVGATLIGMLVIKTIAF